MDDEHYFLRVVFTQTELYNKVTGSTCTTRKNKYEKQIAEVYIHSSPESICLSNSSANDY